MADSDTVKEAEAAMVNLILDEVTGEKVSKSELKRRQKAREKDAKKKGKDAAAPPKVEKRASVEDEESDLTPNVSIHDSDLLGVISNAGAGNSLIFIFHQNV
jgi:lysyl-tRNA synthetase class 2